MTRGWWADGRSLPSHRPPATIERRQGLLYSVRNVLGGHDMAVRPGRPDVRSRIKRSGKRDPKSESCTSSWWVLDMDRARTHFVLYIPYLPIRSNMISVTLARILSTHGLAGGVSSREERMNCGRNCSLVINIRLLVFFIMLSVVVLYEVLNLPSLGRSWAYVNQAP